MLDLVGNPEDRFSRVMAHILHDHSLLDTTCNSRAECVVNEPVHEKTNNLGFRPGPTQTRLYSHRRWLEA